MTRTIRHTLTSALLVVMTVPAMAFAQEPEPEYETTRIGDGIYMYRYRSHNAMFVVTGDGVIAFDPISRDAARIYRQEIADVTSEPVRRIVYSHHHADHITGARTLDPDALIIAHANAHDRLTADPDPDIPAPDVTFTDEMTLRMGTKTVRLLYLGRNHSDNMLIAQLPEDRTIFAVDFVSDDAVGYRDLPGYYFPDLWESLERLQRLDYETAIFGHGPPGTKADVYEQMGYWTELRRAVEAAHANRLSEDEAVASIDLPGYATWRGYETWFKMNVRTLYRHYAGQ